MGKKDTPAEAKDILLALEFFQGVLQKATSEGIQQLYWNIDVIKGLVHGRFTRDTLQYLLLPIVVKTGDMIWQFRLVSFGRSNTTNEGIRRLGTFRPAGERDFDLLLETRPDVVEAVLGSSNAIILFGDSDQPDAECTYITEGDDHRVVRGIAGSMAIWQSQFFALGILGPMKAK